MASKLCTDCEAEPKKAGHPRYCFECWLYRQPVIQVHRFVEARLALVPAELRKARVPQRLWPPGRRWCSGCQSFVRLRDCSGSQCKICASTARHASSIATKYKINGRPFTESDYAALLAIQDDRCYLCRRRAGGRRLAIDHDHTTGEVRGLLCSDPDWGCNLKVLSRFDADPDPVAMAERLVAYLQGATPAAQLTSLNNSC